MQQSKQPFWARLQLFAWLTLNAGKHVGNQPARVAQLDHGNDRAIRVQGDEGSAQVVRLGHRGTPSIKCSDEVAMPRSPPHSVYRSRSCERLIWALPIGDGGTKGGATYRLRPRDGNACLKWLPLAFPFAEGPRVRIRFPPAKSPLRTDDLNAWISESAGDLVGIKRPRLHLRTPSEAKMGYPAGRRREGPAGTGAVRLTPAGRGS